MLEKLNNLFPENRKRGTLFQSQITCKLCSFHPRLEARIFRNERGLCAVAPLCLPPPGQHRGQVLHGSDRGVQRAPGPPVSWKDSDLKIQGRNPNEQKEWTWRSNGPKGEVQVSEVGSRSSKLNIACIQKSHNTISQTKLSHNLWFHSMTEPLTGWGHLVPCFIAHLCVAFDFVLLHCVVFTLYSFIASYRLCIDSLHRTFLALLHHCLTLHILCFIASQPIILFHFKPLSLF